MALLEKFPDAHLVVVCKSASVPIFATLSQRVSVFSKPESIGDWLTLIGAIIKTPNRCVWLPHASTAGLALAKLTLSKSVCPSPIQHRLLGRADLSCPVRLNPWRHTADAFLDSLRLLGYEIRDADRRIHVKSLLDRDIESVKGIPDKKYVVMHPGSRWMFKSPSSEVWSQICRTLSERGYTIVVTGGADLQEKSVCESLGNIPSVINVAGKTDLYQLAQLIKNAEGFIGIDTFSMHLAAGVGTPGVVLFGPTSELIWGPYGMDNRLHVITSEHSCRPCHTDGCGGGKVSDCLDTLDPDMITETFVRVIDANE
jgi:ADP-heptose:LPS heptosyltransferase